MPDRHVTEISQQSGELAAGTIFAERFEILSKLGEGGMSVVYKARQLNMDRVVALKVLRGRMLADSKSYQRFRREAHAVSAMNHPNIVRILVLQTDATQPYMAMEYVDGGSLADYLHTHGKIAANEAVSILTQAARGLAHAHEHGILHRDIKPANIMLKGAENHVQVVDFGVAELLDTQDGSEQKLTQTGAIVGTPYYMSPEQCEKKPLDVRSDIYSLGCVLYQMLVGEPLFEGESPYAVMFRHIHETPPELPSSVPAWLQAVCMRMLEKDPAQRFGSMSELVSTLTQPSDQRAVPQVVPRGKVVPAKRFVLVAAIAAVLVACAVLIVNLGSAPPSNEQAIASAQEAFEIGESTPDARHAQRYYRRGAEIARKESRWQLLSDCLWRSGMRVGNPDGKADATEALHIYSNQIMHHLGDPSWWERGIAQMEEYKREFGETPFGADGYARLQCRWYDRITYDYGEQKNMVKAADAASKWRSCAEAVDDAEQTLRATYKYIASKNPKGEELRAELMRLDPWLAKLVAADPAAQKADNDTLHEIAMYWHSLDHNKALSMADVELRCSKRWQHSDPESFAALEVQPADLYWDLGEHAKAAELWSHALSILQQSKRITGKRTALALCDKLRAAAYLAPVNNADVIRVSRIGMQLQKTLSDGGDRVTADERLNNLLPLANALSAQHRYEESSIFAEECLAELRHLKPDDVKWLAVLDLKGKNFVGLKKFDDADKYFALACERIHKYKYDSPLVVWTLSDRAYAAAQAGHFDSAIAFMKEEKQAIQDSIGKSNSPFTKKTYADCNTVIAQWQKWLLAKAPHAN